MSDLSILKKSEISSEEFLKVIQDPLKTETCNCCNKKYNPKKSFVLYTNYGGTNRKINYCSENCADEVIFVIGNRVSKNPLKNTMLWR